MSSSVQAKYVSLVAAGEIERDPAQARAVADYLAERGFFRSPKFRAERFVLFSSRASTGGGPYVVEEAFPLADSQARRAI